MLSIMFVATRMYALSITTKRGAPASWVQDGMYMATWSLQISGLMCLATGLIMAKVETDREGYVVHKFSKWSIGIVVVAIRYTSMLLLYVGMVMVTIGLFTMTPGSADGRGSIPDVSNAMPFASGPSH